MPESTPESLLHHPPDGGSLETAVARAAVLGQLFGRSDPPVTLGRYEVHHRLGGGAHGEVFAGHDPLLDRPVAIKVLAPGPDPEARVQRVAREARALALVSHVHVVEIYDVGADDARVFIVMERVDGHDLAHWLAHDRPTPAQIIAVFVAAGRGLAAAHRGGVIHRDFKPSNALIGADGMVKVVDFGLASQRTPATREGAAGEVTLPYAGTPAYMAPEQHRGAQVSPATDQFALCVALWEALHGALPFAGSTLEALHDSKQTGVGARRPMHADRRVAAVLRRGLSPDPRRRFASMDALLTALSSRRRTLFAWAPPVAAAATVAVVVVAQTDRTTPCPGPATLRWSSDHAARLHSAFSASELPVAPTQAERAVAAMDRYAERWQDARRGACTAAAIDTNAMHTTVRCLLEASAEFDGVAEMLLDADNTVVTSGWNAIEALPAPDRCLQAEPDGAPDRSDPAVQALRRRLAHVRGLHNAGRLLQARDEAQSLQAPAAAVGGETEVTAIFRLAMVHEALGQADDAEQDLRRAYFLAEARDLPSWSTATAAQLASLAGMRNAPQEAARWLRHSEAALHAAGDLPDDRVVWLTILGRHQAESGALDDALASYATARGLLEGPRSDPRLGRVSAQIAYVHVLRGELPRAQQESEAAIEQQIQFGGPNDPDIFPLSVQLGHVLAQRGQFEQARAAYERGLAVAAMVGTDRTARAANAHEALGVAAYDADRYEIAHQAHARALALREALYGHGDPRTIDSQFNLAVVASAQGDYATARPIFLEALRQLEALPSPPDEQLSMVLTGLGETERATGHHEASVEVLRRALRVRDAMDPDPDPGRTTETAGHLAMSLAAAGASPEVLQAALDRVRRQFREHGESAGAPLAEIEAWCAEHGGPG